MAKELPPRLYRVQHDKSFTMYSPDFGFEARGHYHMSASHWLNEGTIARHLDWKDESEQPTPFISMFDDIGKVSARGRPGLLCRKLIPSIGKARERAQLFQKLGKTHVFIAEINTLGLKRQDCTIQFENCLKHLPVWQDSDKTITLFAMRDAKNCFNINFRIVQDSEWLSIDEILAERIKLWRVR